MGSFLQSRFYQDYLSVFSTIVKTIARNSKKSKFEPEVAVLGRLVAAGSICIDIGGAYGRYALPLSNIVGSAGRVYCFEPGRYSHRVLTSIKRIYNLKNVVIIKAALSDSEKTIKLFSPVKTSGKIGPSLAHIGEGEEPETLSEDVPMTTLDRFCAKEQIAKVDFIKCDIEGAELLAYRGAQRTIERDRPIILSEVDDGNLKRYGHSAKALEDFFTSRDYRLAVYDEGKLRSIEYIGQNRNYLFIPASRWDYVMKQEKDRLSTNVT